MKLAYSLSLLALLSTSSALAQTTLTFTPLASLPDGGRYGMGYCQDQNSFYMVGGGSPAATYNSSVFRYSVANNTWTPAPTGTNVTPQRWTAAAIVDPNPSTGSIYVFNGATPAPVTTLQILPLSGGAGIFSPNPTPTSTAGVAVWNGLIYTFGGQDASGTYSNQLRSFNPTTNTWSNLAPMLEARQTYGAAINGKIYTVGGYNGVVNSARVDAYDIATNQWQALGTLPATVSNQAVAVQGEWLWLVGDFTNQSFLAAYNTRTTELRTFTSNLPLRRNAAAIVRDNRLYVWGGNTAASNASTLTDMWQANLAGVLANSTARPTAPQLSAYPNPSTTGEFTLTLPVGTRTLEVHDALGRLVQTAEPTTTSYLLRLSRQPAGVYSVRARTSQGLSAPCQLVRP